MIDARIMMTRIRGWFLLLAGLLSLYGPTAIAGAAPAFQNNEPAAMTSTADLIGDSGFERGGEGWSVCGSPTLVTRGNAGITPLMVRSGQHAFRIGNPTGQDCPDFVSAHQALVHPITIPANASGLTVSFWYSRVGEPFDAPLRVALTPAEEPVAWYSGSAVMLDTVQAHDLDGWSFYRQALRPEELQRVRGKTVNMALVLSNILAAEHNFSYYIDDVQVTLAEVRTLPSSMPTDLAAIAKSHLMVLRPNPAADNSVMLVQMTPGGANAQPAVRFPAFDGLYATPSPDGNWIATVSQVFAGSVTNAGPIAEGSRISVVNRGTGERREIAFTAGDPGALKQPPGCIGRAGCASPEKPALNQRMRGVAWSQDSQLLAITMCSQWQYRDKDQSDLVNGNLASDEVCRVEVREARSAALVTTFDDAFRASWGPGNKLVFETIKTIAGTARTPGLWEADLSKRPPTTTMIFPNAYLLGNHRELAPSYSPDGRLIASLRQVSGMKWAPDGTGFLQQALMIFDRQNPSNPRTLLLLDHGLNSVHTPVWSPDGKYLFYVLGERDGSTNVWWVDITTGATGPVTTDGKSLYVSWTSSEPPSAPPTPRSRAVYVPLLSRG